MTCWLLFDAAPRFVSLLETFLEAGANMPETRRYPLNIPG
jgi:hypothetical protein